MHDVFFDAFVISKEFFLAFTTFPNVLFTMILNES
jgi:hypothetical protein